MTETHALPKWLWIPRLLAAGIVGQTLFFKFTGAELPVHILRPSAPSRRGVLAPRYWN